MRLTPFLGHGDVENPRVIAPGRIAGHTEPDEMAKRAGMRVLGRCLWAKSIKDARCDRAQSTLPMRICLLSSTNGEQRTGIWRFLGSRQRGNVASGLRQTIKKTVTRAAARATFLLTGSAGLLTPANVSDSIACQKETPSDAGAGQGRD